MSDFVIENGVLTKYTGNGGDVVIPEGVTSIGEYVFRFCNSLKKMRICTSIKLIKDVFGGAEPDEIYVPDPAQLPNDLKPAAAVGFANEPDDPKSERGKKHIKYMKSNAAKLIDLALENHKLLVLLLEQKCLKPEVAEAYLAAAQKKQDAEAIALLLDYQANKLTDKEKQKAVEKAETREEKITDFVFSAEALEKIQGKKFVVTGKLNTFTRAEFKACLEEGGAILTETLNAETDYLITNTPYSGSAKNKKAEQLGVKKITEDEFNQMIGRT